MGVIENKESTNARMKEKEDHRNRIRNFRFLKAFIQIKINPKKENKAISLEIMVFLYISAFHIYLIKLVILLRISLGIEYKALFDTTADSATAIRLYLYVFAIHAKPNKIPIPKSIVLNFSFLKSTKNIANKYVEAKTPRG